jgi:hypothetical protein
MQGVDIKKIEAWETSDGSVFKSRDLAVLHNFVFSCGSSMKKQIGSEDNFVNATDVAKWIGRHAKAVSNYIEELAKNE